MNLVVTSPRRLHVLYGEQGAREVLALTRRLVRLRSRLGIASRLLAVEDGAPGLGVPGVEPEPGPVAAQIGAVASVLERGGRRLESVLIVGGPEVLPFDQIPNPMPLDGDSSVPSDHCYARRRSDELLPEWPVGRLPGSAARPTTLARLIRHTMLLHVQPPDGDLLSFGYSAAIWGRAARHVYRELSDQPPLLSPPVVATTLDLTLLDRARYIYCNLHGVRDSPVWYGQATEQRGLVVALRPSDLQGRRLRGAVVVSEACYAAAISGRDERSSMALAFLAHGAAGFVGATAVTYGPIVPPLGEADLIALHFLRALKRPRTTLGAAFNAALAGMLADTIARQPALDDNDLKTALSFVLYGDPMLMVGPTAYPTA